MIQGKFAPKEPSSGFLQSIYVISGIPTIVFASSKFLGLINSLILHVKFYLLILALALKAITVSKATK